MLANWLVDKRKKDHPTAYCFGTDNAFTIITQGRKPVQFIHRWTFNDPLEVAVSFDFSIAAAAVWYDVDRKVWLSDCDEISPESLGKLMARLNQGVKYSDFLEKDEAWQAQVYTGLLREVDPLTIIDGVEAVEGNDGNFHQRADGDHGWVQIHGPNS